MQPHLFKATQGNWFQLWTLHDTAYKNSYSAVAKLGVIGGVSKEEKRDLLESDDPAYLVRSWLACLIARRYKAETCVDPPILRYVVVTTASPRFSEKTFANAPAIIGVEDIHASGTCAAGSSKISNKAIPASKISVRLPTLPCPFRLLRCVRFCVLSICSRSG